MTMDDSIITALKNLLRDYKETLEAYNNFRVWEGYDKDSLDESAIVAEKIIEQYESDTKNDSA